MCVFLGVFRDILWAKTEFEILSLRHLMNKSMNLGRKIGYFGMAGVKLHTIPHSCRINQNDPLFIRNEILKVQISEPDQMSLLVRVTSNILLHKCYN